MPSKRNPYVPQNAGRRWPQWATVAALLLATGHSVEAVTILSNINSSAASSILCPGLAQADCTVEGGANPAVLLPGARLAGLAEVRIGTQGNGNYELDIQNSTAFPGSGVAFPQGQFSFTSGTSYPFVFTYDKATNRVMFEFGSGSSKVTLPASGSFLMTRPITDLFLRTRATKTGSAIRVDNLRLNGVALTGVASKAFQNDTSLGGFGTSRQIDYAVLRDVQSALGFNLAGNLTMTYTGPQNGGSALAFQLKAGEGVFPQSSVPEPGTWVMVGCGLIAVGRRARKRG